VRIAVISDVHANLRGLEAVLADIAAEAPDEIWCLGDVVGYGPKPNECCALVAERVALSLCGNHDLAVVGALDLDDFAGDAGVAARWTRDVLEEPNRAWLASLAPSGAREGIELFHASARDPVWEYILSEQVALHTLAATSAAVVLVGHSHIPLAIGWDADGVAGSAAPAGTAVELLDARWLLNPGSVGQPRDGDPRAAWLLLDLAGGTAEFRRTVYDIEATQAEMAAAGLPKTLAARLSLGL
jgi:predicted phosphodiesterase